MPPFRPVHPILNAYLDRRIGTERAGLEERLRNGASSARLWKAWTQLNSQAEARHQLALRTEPSTADVGLRQPSVMAVMPFLADHDLIAAALQSIAQQTRKPCRLVIAVDNDADGQTGQAVTARCQQILADTLPYSVRSFSGLNGPYRMLNQIINEADDVSQIWLHDSDDLSHPSRLEKQLWFSSRHQLDLCSSFELRIRTAAIDLIHYPINAGRALRVEPGHCMLWPGSLIRRSLWQHLQGCSDLYRFGADTEFQLRASFVARMGNYPAYLYARRARSNSLTNNKDTGLRSWTRGYMNSTYKADYYQRQLEREAGNPLDLSPRFRLDEADASQRMP
jgi:glycosyltransferase involved in cell wall biosynthesis